MWCVDGWKGGRSAVIVQIGRCVPGVEWKRIWFCVSSSGSEYETMQNETPIFLSVYICRSAMIVFIFMLNQ